MRLLGAGAILREVEAAAEMLAREYGVSSEMWSVTSFTELRREGLDVERWNMLASGSRPAELHSSPGPCRAERGR